MADPADNSENSSLVWRELSRRAAFVSHRLIGWIYWDPEAIENYAALGVPDGIGSVSYTHLTLPTILLV